jgi:hypothetical protein
MLKVLYGTKLNKNINIFHESLVLAFYFHISFCSLKVVFCRRQVLTRFFVRQVLLYFSYSVRECNKIHYIAVR